MVTAAVAGRQRAIVTLALCAGVALLTLMSLGIGPVALSPATILHALFGDGSEVQRIIVLEFRLPRTILAIAIGAILGLSGAALQGLLRNPLASPSLFGAPQTYESLTGTAKNLEATMKDFRENPRKYLRLKIF